MPERRRERRDEGGDRRRFPRPSLWLNIVLLTVACALAFGAKVHRESLDDAYQNLVQRDESTPAEIRAIKSDLAGMDLTREALVRELDSRLKYAQSLRTAEFHLAIDTTKKKLLLHYGDQIVREVDVIVGAPQIVKGPRDKSWTFVPLKGAFVVLGKEADASWQIPSWVYVMNKQPIPDPRPKVQAGLGKLVVYLPNNYVIHSPPSPESPLKGPKPGSFMISEEDLKAIWPRIDEKTRVFVF